MVTITKSVHVGPDGILRVETPVDERDKDVRVTLVVQAEPEGERKDWWQVLQEGRARLEASGHRFRTKEEIDAEIAELREDWD